MSLLSAGSKLSSAKEELLKIEEKYNKELLQLFYSFSAEEINKIPYEGSWTPGQVAEHLYKSDTLILKTLNSAEKPADRPIDANVDNLKKTFLDFNTKLNSPQAIIPANTTHKKEDILHSLEQSRAAIHEAIETMDLTLLCPNPLLGEPTRYELFRFVFIHTERHIHQLKKIAKHFAS